MSNPFPPSGTGANPAIAPGLNPFMLPSRWDQITIGGQTWAGKIDIRGAERFYKWQPKDTRGAESWNDTYQGLKPKPFTIVFFVYTSSQGASWPAFSSQFVYFGNKNAPQPVTISHPSLFMLGITSVRVNKVGALHKISDDLMFAADVEFQQWQPAPQPGSAAANVTSTPTSAKARPTTPYSPSNPEIKNLEQQIESTQAALRSTGTPPGSS